MIVVGSLAMAGVANVAMAVASVNIPCGNIPLDMDAAYRSLELGKRAGLACVVVDDVEVAGVAIHQQDRSAAAEEVVVVGLRHFEAFDPQAAFCRFLPFIIAGKVDARRAFQPDVVTECWALDVLGIDQDENYRESAAIGLQSFADSGYQRKADRSGELSSYRYCE